MNDSAPPRLHLEITSDPSGLGAVRRQIEPFALNVGFDEESAGHIMLALDEALTNIIRHAYEGKTDQPIEIDLTKSDNRLCIAVRDYGRVVPTERIRSRNLDDIRPGGLGVHIMTECMDQVNYAPAEGGGTRLTMTKQLPRYISEGHCDE